MTMNIYFMMNLIVLIWYHKYLYIFIKNGQNEDLLFELDLFETERIYVDIVKALISTLELFLKLNWD